MYYVHIDYFDVDGVSSIDGVNYSAGSLVASVQYSASVSDLNFVLIASSVFNSDKTLSTSFDILDDSEILHRLDIDLHSTSDFTVNFDLPFQLFVTSKALFFLSSFINGNTGTTDTSLLTSLNGNFGSYPDGAQVVVQGLTTRTYTVQSSSLGWDSPSTGSLIITYRLKDADDNFLEAPHVLLTLKA